MSSPRSVTGRPAPGARGPAVAVATCVAAAVVIGGCGGSTTAAPPPRRTYTYSSTLSPSPPGALGRAHRSGHAPRVGVTQFVRSGTGTLSVTLVHVYDPLTDSGATLLPGTQAAGVAITIRNDSGATYDSTSSGDLSVVTSSGRATPLFIDHGVCQTPLTDFESLIGVGETRSGCVGFSVGRGARITAVRFSPDSRRAGTVSWR